MGIVEQLSQRMTSLETRMTSLETRMDAGFRDIHRRMDSGFRWIVGIQFTTLVALGTLILISCNSANALPTDGLHAYQ